MFIVQLLLGVWSTHQRSPLKNTDSHSPNSHEVSTSLQLVSGIFCLPRGRVQGDFKYRGGGELQGKGFLDTTEQL